MTCPTASIAHLASIPGMRPPTLAVTSGKGGVGKTNVVANLAVAMARTGRRVTVLDADFGLANLDVLLGLSPPYTIEHVFRGNRTLSEIAVAGPAGIRVIPATSGVPDLARLDARRRAKIARGIEELRQDCDLLLIDTAAGIAENVSSMLLAADRVMVVTSPDPTALVDAYAVLKVLAHRDPHKDVGLLVNGADADEAARIHAQIQSACRHFLGRSVALEGHVVHDPALEEAVRQQRAMVESHPLAPASRCFEQLAGRLGTSLTTRPGPDFWDRIAEAGRTSAVHGD
jgi:flagellar biosynthesis protein FlhG